MGTFSNCWHLYLCFVQCKDCTFGNKVAKIHAATNSWNQARREPQHSRGALSRSHYDWNIPPTFDRENFPRPSPLSTGLSFATRQLEDRGLEPDIHRTRTRQIDHTVHHTRILLLLHTLLVIFCLSNALYSSIGHNIKSLARGVRFGVVYPARSVDKTFSVSDCPCSHGRNF